MSMLNKFLGRKEGGTGSPASGSPSSQRDQGAKARNQDDNVSIVSQGFLCPICYRSFDNSDLLSSHFANEHDAPSSNNDSNEASSSKSPTSNSLNSSAVDSILKKYTSGSSPQPPTSDTESLVDTKSVSSFNDLAQIFSSTFSSSGSREQVLEKELYTTREKLHTAEEIKSILTNDIKELQERVDRLGSDNKKLGSYKINSDEKLKSALEQISKSKVEREQLASENESLKTHLAQMQEEFVKNAAHINNLEKELAVRPTTDDLNLLKKELVQVQQLTDTILKEKENEQKQLMREQKELTTRLEQKDKELEVIRDKVDSLKELQELREKVKSLEERNSQAEKTEQELRSELSQKQETIEKQVNDLEGLKSKNDQLESEVKLKMNQINEYLVEIKQLSQEKSQLNQNIAELEIKKAELSSRIIHETTPKSENGDDESSASLDDSKNSHLDALIKEKEELENELIKLRTKNQSIYEEKVAWLNEKNEFLVKSQQADKDIQELNGRIKSLEDCKAKLEADKAELDKKVIELENAVQNAQSLNTQQTTQYEQEKQRLVDENAQKINQANDSITRLQSEKEELEKQKANLGNEIDSLNQLNEENRRLINELNGKLDETQQAMNQTSEEVGKKKQEIDTLTTQLAEKSSELERLKSEYEQQSVEFQVKFDKQETEKDELNKKLELTCDNLKQIESSLQGEVGSLKIALENTNVLNDDLSSKLEKSNNEKEELNARLISLEDEKESLESKLSETNKSLEQARDELGQVKSSLDSLQSKYDSETGRMAKEAENLSIKIERLAEQNEELTIERDDCEKMRLDAIKKHETQLKALNQNLASLRMEARTQSDKLTGTQNELNTIKGVNLELEAKLSNCTDERNQLLERCLTAEKLCETYKTQNIELKRRVEEGESALHELAREHQSLQVQNNKRLSSKWVDDSQVDECLQCKKQFSVIIRKHHCRNCGQVFCNECSSHSAQISASRNPQRVCKACFIELTQ